MNEDCPACGHILETQVYVDQQERVWNLLYCPACDYEYCRRADGSLAALPETYGTRPIPCPPASLPEEPHA